MSEQWVQLYSQLHSSSPPLLTKIMCMRSCPLFPWEYPLVVWGEQTMHTLGFFDGTLYPGKPACDCVSSVLPVTVSPPSHSSPHSSYKLYINFTNLCKLNTNFTNLIQTLRVYTDSDADLWLFTLLLWLCRLLWQLVNYAKGMIGFGCSFLYTNFEIRGSQN